MVTILFCIGSVVGQFGPRPPQAPSVEARLAAHDLAIAELRAEIFALKAKAGITQVPPKVSNFPAPTPPPAAGYVAVTAAKEVSGFHPVKAAVNVATAPAKMLQRICEGGVCRVVEVDVPNYGEYIQNGVAVKLTEPPTCPNWTDVGFGNPSGASYGGSCANGQCGQQRRGWFGRRR